MSSSGPDTPVLFLHGAMHGSWCWSEVVARVTAAGTRAIAVDMAGHGLRARRPQSATRRPFDPGLLATEPSPVAGIDLGQASELLVSQIEQLGGGSPVVVVAHSLGGIVLTRAAQMAPGLVANAVYLSALMPASGVSPMVYLQLPEMVGGVFLSSIVGDPATIGAVRLDVGSPDPADRQRLRELFYGDVDAGLADAAIGLLTPDTPLALGAAPTTLTAEGWGSVPRTFVMCTRDNVFPVSVQQRFIAEADAAFPGNPTTVCTLETSHSPFLSAPGDLADIILKLSC
jgi:pimeloyl-ACP methyl ester carboxylesterase